MADETLRVEKRKQPVRLWVHPEGQVVGNLFVRPGETDDEDEDPLEVLNGEGPFVVVHVEAPDEVRFYSKRSIVRVEHDVVDEEADDVTVLRCGLQMMDGLRMEGSIREVLPPEHRRLYDYLNLGGAGFLRIYLDDGTVSLVNKAYIVRATELSDEE